MTKSFVSDATTTGFLAECVPFDVFCRDYLHVSPRTGQRRVNKPNGLPIVEYGAHAAGPRAHGRCLG